MRMSPQKMFPVVGLAARGVPPNRWYGLRVPPTFTDEQVWYAANAVAGRDMMALGALIVVVAFVLARGVGLADSTYSIACAGLLGVGALILTVRGWRTANRLHHERHHGPDLTS